MHLLEPVEEASDSDDIPLQGDFLAGKAWADDDGEQSSLLELEPPAGLAFALSGSAFGGAKFADSSAVWTPAGSQDSWFPAPSQPVRAPAEEDADPGPASCEDELAAASIFHSAIEVALGDTVHYWSASKQNWLPGKFLGADPRGRLLVDKQNLGCICALIPADVMTKADKADRILRLLDALEHDQE